MSIEELLKDALEETASELEVDYDKARALIADQASKLVSARNEPGFMLAVRASRDVVCLELGISASLQAEALEQRLVGMIQVLIVSVLL